MPLWTLTRGSKEARGALYSVFKRSTWCKGETRVRDSTWCWEVKRTTYGRCVEMPPWTSTRPHQQKHEVLCTACLKGGH